MKNEEIKFLYNYSQKRIKELWRGDEHWILEGECKRCGVCCDGNGKPCEFLDYENIDRKRLAKCKRQRNKPYKCAFYPFIPLAKLWDGCGYHWRKADVST